MFNMLRGGVGSVVVRALSCLCLFTVGCGIDLDDFAGSHAWHPPAAKDVDATVTACVLDPVTCFGADPATVTTLSPDVAPQHIHLHAARIDTSTGEITDGGARVTIPSLVLPGVANGTAIRAFIVDELTIDNASVFASGTTHGPALGVVATGDITLLGTLSIDSSAGSMSGTQCNAADGIVVDRTDASGVHASYAAGGGGGGGFGSAGALGGTVTSSTNPAPGGPGGVVNGAQGLIPLRGGCAGGNTDDTGGGGAVELASRHIIEIDGTIDVRGRDGAIHNAGPRGGTLASGGGSGGGLLLEAPAIRFAPDAELLAGGGFGGGANTTWCDPSVCGNGGDGATLTMAARAGADMADATTDIAAGGGGGGLGRIRINTETGLRDWPRDAYVEGQMTSGIIGTR